MSNNHSRSGGYKKYLANSNFRPRATSAKYKAGDTFDEQGSFESTRFGPSDDGFVIGNFAIDGGETIVCKGTVPGFVLGAPYHITGKVIDDKTWGIQVNIKHAVGSKPTTEGQLEAFLGSGAVPGIGPVTARKIVQHFGKDTLKVLEDDPERLKEVSGIGEKSIKRIAEELPSQLKYRDVIGFFASLGISVRTINRLIAEYGGGAKDIGEKNPYILCRVRGFAFTRADSIAMKMGISKTDRNRLYAGVMATLRYICESEGHTVVSEEDLIAKSQEKLQVSDITKLSRAIEELLYNKRVVKDDAGYHLKHLYDAEKTIKKCLRASVGSDILLRGEKVEDYLSVVEKHKGFSLTDEQANAVRNVFKYKISILSGKAGTGKTAVSSAIVEICQLAGIPVCLMSPTGRAAKHLSDTCGGTEPGYTMHRALSIQMRAAQDDDFFDEDQSKQIRTKNITEAVEHFNNAEIVIADEASMMDTEMAAILFQACKNKHLMLVGDPNQLPSVGPGRVLGDLMESSYSQVHGMLTFLTKVFRQKEGSPVINAANLISEGKNPVHVPGVKFFEVSSNEEVPDKIEKHVLPYIKERQLGYENYAFLSPIKKTPHAGVDALNAYLRPKLNPYYKKPASEKQEFLFQRGDFVMQTKNNYEVDIYNGDIGIVEAVDKDCNVEVLFSGDDDEVCYEKDEVYGDHQIIPAFAMTVHKSQGDQYDTVIVVLTSSQFPMLNRNLLYTAVTRAENELILIGDSRAFAMAASNQKENKRKTGLRGI